jgi:hypothetical protein
VTSFQVLNSRIVCNYLRIISANCCQRRNLFQILSKLLKVRRSGRKLNKKVYIKFVVSEGQGIQLLVKLGVKEVYLFYGFLATAISR